jgi:S1-C subfamily serine protease
MAADAGPARTSRWRAPRRPRIAVPLLALVLAVVTGGVWRMSAGGGTAPLTKADVDRAVAQGIAKAQQEQQVDPPDATVAYQTILPSLVTITTGPAPAAAGSTASGSPASGSAESGNATGSLGAGVVVNADGSVLTALHVVAGGNPITVRFADGTTTTAKISRSQKDKDIAVLAVDRLPEVVVPAVLGGGVQIGDAVFPVGNPLGLNESLSAGVVSALGRTVRTESGPTLKGLIQFDAAVNPGNSGGPLLDRHGSVVGVVTGLANPSNQSYFVGIGFAVPIEVAGGVAGGPPV